MAKIKFRPKNGKRHKRILSKSQKWIRRYYFMTALHFVWIYFNKDIIFGYFKQAWNSGVLQEGFKYLIKLIGE